MDRRLSRAHPAYGSTHTCWCHRVDGVAVYPLPKGPRAGAKPHPCVGVVRPVDGRHYCRYAEVREQLLPGRAPAEQVSAVKDEQLLTREVTQVLLHLQAVGAAQQISVV